MGERAEQRRQHCPASRLAKQASHGSLLGDVVLQQIEQRPSCHWWRCQRLVCVRHTCPTNSLKARDMAICLDYEPVEVFSRLTTGGLTVTCT